MFSGGFDLQSACAVAGSDDTDDYAVLDLLDAFVRKSLLVADRSTGRARYSILETIRQFAEEQLVASGAATEVRAAQPATSPGAKPTSLQCGTAPASGRRTTGLQPSWPTCAPRFDGPPTTATSMSPPPSRPTRGSRHWGRKLRADRLGRRANRARPRPRPPLARDPVRDRVAVLDGRTGRRGCPLQRRRSDGGRQ